MRSLAYKHLIWNSTWYKKYRRPFTIDGRSDLEKQTGMSISPKKQPRRTVKWWQRMTVTIH